MIGQLNPYLVFGLLVGSIELWSFLRRRAPTHQSWLQRVSRVATALLFVGVMTLALTKWLDYTIRGSAVSTDFTQDYLSGYALRQSVAIYGPAFKEFSVNLFPLAPDNNHPPFNAVLFLPFSYLPYAWAFYIWSLCSLLAYVAILVSVLKAHGFYSYLWIRLSSLLLLWEPFTANIGLGQVSALLALSIVVGFWLLRSGWEKTAGTLFAFATLVKLFPGLLLLYLLSQRRWRAISGFMIASAAGMAITVWMVGIDSVLYYVSAVIPRHHEVFAGYPVNISIEGFLRAIFESNQYGRPLVAVPEYVPMFTWLVAGILVALLWRSGSRHRKNEGTDDLFFLYCVTMLLVSPITWNHTCIVLIFPILILLRDGIMGKHRTFVQVVVIVLMLFWIPLPSVVNYLIVLYSPAQTPWYFMVAAKTGFFALAILWITFYQRLRLAVKKT